MEYRPLELTVISAKDIQDVNLIGKMDVYVVVTLGGDSKTKQKTPVDKDGGRNPNWNHHMRFNINETAAQKGGLVLVFKILAERTLGGDKEIGDVHVPVKELLESTGKGNSAQFVSYQVRKPCGKAKGQLNFSYKFGEKISAPMAAASKGSEPVTAYPAAVGTGAAYVAAVGSSSGYPPAGAAGYPPYPPPPQGAYPPPAGYPQPVAGYGGYPPAPPPGGYPYPPPQPGYGYPPQQGYPNQPVQQPQKKKNNFGLGLGAGLLGGLLVGDMIADASGCGGGCGGGGCGGGGCGGGF